MENCRWAWAEQVCGMWYFLPSVLWHCWLGDRIRPCDKAGCWFVDGDSLTGALHVL